MIALAGKMLKESVANLTDLDFISDCMRCKERAVFL